MRPATAPLAFDDAKCTRCGLCVQICPEDVLEQAEGEIPAATRPEACIACGHCVAVCPHDAVAHTALPEEGFAPARDAGIAAEGMQAFLASKRSIRHFSGRPIKREVVERLLVVAGRAPSDNNSQARGFTVVTDRETTARLERDVARHFGRLLFWLNRPVRRVLSLLMPATIEELEKVVPDLRAVARGQKAGGSPVFRGAPCVVFIHGPAGNTLSRDNCIAAQHYLMLQAEAMGLGSCIIGYATAARSAVQRHLELPAGHRVYAATILGYPRFEYRKAPARRPPQVTWQ